ncbi:Clavaminate synthase-like protein [Mycena floridula]|nr:Clavaminate synthase-like protein [Mycena floridula]
MLDYTAIPILDWSLSQTDKPLFIAQLRDAIINVGFLYLKNSPVPPEVLDQVVEFAPKFFALPQDAKDAVDMEAISPSLERTQINGSSLILEETELVGISRVEPEYLKLHGDALGEFLSLLFSWPDEALIPGFRNTMLTYYNHVEDLSFEFTERVAEALGLPPNALDAFFDPDRKKLQPRCKLLYYPPPVDGVSAAGHAPHADRSFMTYLLQASDEPGLEVKNLAGDWVPVPPIKHTFVINLGRSLEKATHGAAIATVHRVVSPIHNPRYSVAFFSSIALEVRLADVQLELPEEVLEMQRARDEKTGNKAEFKYTETDRQVAGLLVLDKKLKFHPIVTQKFYPALFDKYFPSGVPAFNASEY